MIACNAWAYCDDFCRYEGKPPVPLCDEEEYGVSALNRLYPAADKSWLCLRVRSDAEFRRLAEALGREDIASDPRFATRAARAEHDAELREILAGAVAGQTALAWEAQLSAADLGAAAVSMAGQASMIADDAGLQESGLTRAYEHPLFGPMVRWAPPVDFSAVETRFAPPCRRGEHNRAILAGLGYD